MTSLAVRLILVAVVSGVLLGCAQTGPPLPPSLELAKPPSDLRAVRKGDRVMLTWSEPTRTTDRQTMRYLGPTRICRSLDAEMKECGTPIGQVAPSTRTGNPSGTQPQIEEFTDTLPAAMQQNLTGDVTYAVEVLNRDLRGAGLSNRIAVLAVLTLPPPADFRAALTDAGVEFTWTSAEGAPAPGIQHRYRIYRRDESSGKDAVAVEAPVGGAGLAHAQDSSFEWEKTYTYRMTAVSIVNRPGGDAQVEGDDTPTLKIVAHDVFPPAAPSGLQAVYSGEGQKAFIDLIWAPVTDADLAGYNVYRRGDSEAPVKLNSELIKAPSYRDSAVSAGKTYFYSVSAADVRGNESARSDQASESAP